MAITDGNIPVVPKFHWQFELFCAGEIYKQERTEISQEQARCIFSILRDNKRWLMPILAPKEPKPVKTKKPKQQPQEGDNDE